MVVDAQGDTPKYIDIAERYELKITDVIETHIQADHLSTSKELADKTGASLSFGPSAKVNFVHQTLTDGAELSVGRRKIRVMHTPGHTAEHICLLVDDWLVLTGDTLFVGDVGRVDLVESASMEKVNEKASELYESVHKLLELPDITEIYPGHYKGSACGKGMDSKPSSTIGRERSRNDVLKLEKEAFIQYLLSDMPAPPRDFLDIKKKNSN